MWRPPAQHPPDGSAGHRRARPLRRLVAAALAPALAAGCAQFQARPIDAGQAAADFDARSLADPSLRAFLEANHVAAPGPGDSWDLKQLTLVAFRYQPALAEARAQLLAAQAAQGTAAARPNPTLTLTPGYDPGIPGSPSPWIVPLSVDVPIETAGKRGHRMEQARDLAVWQARSRVRAALLAIYAADETESLLGRQDDAEANVVRLLEGQLAAGAASSYEVTQARIARDTVQIARRQAQGQRLQALAQLADALGVPARALDGVRFSLAGFERLPGELARPDIRREALVNRADVRGALAFSSRSPTSIPTSTWARATRGTRAAPATASGTSA